MEHAPQLTVYFMHSSAYHDLVVKRIAPAGIVDWGAAGCVSALREAILALAVGGWASVDAAADWISAQYPDQPPEKYGCRTWRQVIHESRRFDLRYRDEDCWKQAWYQERTKVQKVGR